MDGESAGWLVIFAAAVTDAGPDLHKNPTPPPLPYTHTNTHKSTLARARAHPNRGRHVQAAPVDPVPPVDHPRRVRPLLPRDLRRRGQRVAPEAAAVAQRDDVARADDPQVGVDRQLGRRRVAAAVERRLVRDGLDQRPHERPRGVAGRPHAHAVGERLLGPVRGRQLDRVALDARHAHAQAHVDPRRLEVADRLGLQRRRERRQDRLRRLQQGHPHVGHQVGVLARQVGLQEVRQGASKLHARGAPADDDKRQQAPAVLLAGAGQGGELEGLLGAAAELHGVGDLLHEEGVLADACCCCLVVWLFAVGWDGVGWDRVGVVCLPSRW